MNKTAEFFYKICIIARYTGLPNYWVKEITLPKPVQYFNRVGNFLCLYFVLSEFSAVFTQSDLNSKQHTDRALFTTAHVCFLSYIYTAYFWKDLFREAIHYLTVVLRVESEVEKSMVKKSKLYSSGLVGTTFFNMVSYTLDGVMAVVKEGKTFQTVIQGWPRVQDDTPLGNFSRALTNTGWWLFQLKVFSLYCIVITLCVSLSHQFLSLRNYFQSLSQIFADQTLRQREKERKYEERLKIGIKMHIDTLRCKKTIQSVSHFIFGGAIVVNVICAAITMLQLVSSDRTFKSAITIVCTMLTILFVTGLLMLSAGDVTVEALHLPTAMFHSGWQNCQKDSAKRIRKLLLIAICRAQEPVIIEMFGFMQVSYQSYLSIVKSSYSIFSVIY